jgi:hypothetical protein
MGFVLKYLIFATKFWGDLKAQLNLKNAKKKHKHMPLRQPANKTIYEFFMKQKWLKLFSWFAWSRSRIAITLLFFLGLRANEVTQSTKKILDQGSEGHLAACFAAQNRPIQNHGFITGT